MRNTLFKKQSWYKIKEHGLVSKKMVKHENNFTVCVMCLANFENVYCEVKDKPHFILQFYSEFSTFEK